MRSDLAYKDGIFYSTCRKYSRIFHWSMYEISVLFEVFSSSTHYLLVSRQSKRRKYF